jgi:hypothetical protein
MLAFQWTPWWGTFPEYLAAAGTVGAFIAGLWLLRKELNTRRDDVDDRRRAQARLVAAWASPPQLQADPDGRDERQVFYLLTRNGSEEPVRNVTITLYHPIIRPATPLFKPPPLQVAFRARYDVLAPQTTEATDPLRVDQTSPGPVSIIFRDSQGYMWQQERDGILQLIAAPPSFGKRRRSVKDRLDAWTQGQMDELD